MATIPTVDIPHLKVLPREPEAVERRIAPPLAKPEPEQRLWKITTDAVSPKHRYLEDVILVFFGIIAAAAVFLCFSQLFRLLNNDFISQVVKILLQ